MSDLLIRDVPTELKRQLKERAGRQGHNLSRETLILIQRGLAAEKTAESGDSSRVGLGTRLASLIPAELWSDDLIPPRDDGADRPPPDFS